MRPGEKAPKKSKGGLKREGQRQAGRPVPPPARKSADTESLWASPALFWAGVALIALVYGLLRIHALAIPLDRDEGAFGYIGQRILEGGLPYRDGIDHKPPGVFYLYALGLSMVPATASGIHAFLHAYNFLTLAVVMLLLRERFHSRTAVLGGGFCYALFSASPAIQGFTASSEMFMLLPIASCLLLAVAGARRGRWELLLLSGAAGGAAFWIKQTSLTAVAFAPLFLMLRSYLDEGTPADRILSRRLLDLSAWLGGAAAVSAIVMARFYSAGLFQEFLYWSFTHNVVYTGQVPFSQTLSGLGSAIGGILRGDFPMIVLGLAAVGWGFRSHKTGSAFVLGFLLCSAAGTLPGLAYRHYFAQIAPAVAVAAGWGLSLLAAQFRLRTALAAAALLAVPPLAVHADYFVKGTPAEISRTYFGLNPFPESEELAAYLASRTAPQDRIFIFGSEPQILLEAGRRSATPMIMAYPLTRVFPRYLEFQERVWRDVEANRPAYIVLVNIPTSTLWDGKARLEILQKLDSLIQSDYRIEAVLPVRPPRGTLMALGEGQMPGPEVTSHRLNLFVYRRRGG